MTMNLKIALVGAWHVHANDYARDCDNNPHTTLVAVWDANPEFATTAAERWNVPVVADLDKLLADPEIDGVIITTATNIHREVMEKVIASGKHIFTEKVLAATSDDAQAIASAAEQAGVTLTVSLPRLYTGYTRTIRKMLDDGELGTISYVRVRVSHDGAIRRDGKPQWLPEHFFDVEQAGGGAMIDFGAHPYYLMHHFAGMPEAVTAHYLSTSGHDVEDQALVVGSYPGKLTGVAEASFLGGAIGHFIEIHGSDGTLLFDFDNGLRVKLRGDSDWTSRDLVDDASTPYDRWVECIQQGQQDPENVEVALALTRLAAAAEVSAREHRQVAISEGY